MNLSEMLRASGYAGAEADQAFADHLSETSAEVRRRVCALKKLQVDAVKIEADFYERVHQLEKEFQSRFDVVNVKRAEIVSGQREPTDGEADMPLLGSMEKEELESVEKKWNEKNPNSGVAGIPDFWLNVLRGASGINEMVQEQDVPILKHLTDITCSIDEEPKSYTLHFHFSQNEYFTNSVLDKFYEISTGIDEKSPFDYEGPVVISVKGTEINWKDGKNVTKKIIKKKVKKGTSAGKFITKTIKNDSFFNFFDPTVTAVPEGQVEADEEQHDLMRSDFELGQLFRDQIIPRACLYFTGEAVEDDVFEDFDEEDMENDSMVVEE